MLLYFDENFSFKIFVFKVPVCSSYVLILNIWKCWRKLSYFKPLYYWWLIWLIENDAKKVEKWREPRQVGTHMSESYPIHTNMPGFKRLKIFCALVPLTKVGSASKGLRRYGSSQSVQRTFCVCGSFVKLAA